MPFVKSASTSVPSSRSQAELEKTLRRYGCTGFGTHADYTAHRVAVNFRVPDTQQKDAPQVPVRLVVDFLAVYDALYGRPMKRRWVNDEYVTEHDPKGYGEKGLEQAERVAWRQLILWVDAACSAAAAGLQPMSEAFFAHTLVRNADGETLRMVDHLNAVAPGHEWRALLTAGDA